MKSVIIRLVAGLLLLVVGAAIFINTMDVYPFDGYYRYECNACHRQWGEMTPLSNDPKSQTTCPNVGVRYYVNTCGTCGNSWEGDEQVDILVRNFCPHCNDYTIYKSQQPKVVKGTSCSKVLRPVGAKLRTGQDYFLYLGKVQDKLIINTVGGVLAVAGFGLIAFTGYRYFMNKPSKKDED